MKLLKKLSAILLTGIMVAGMCVTSMAVSEGTGNVSPVTEGSVANIQIGVGTVDNGDPTANGDDTLLVYKVVDITYNQESNALIQKFTDSFESFLAAAGRVDFDVEDYGKLENDSNELKDLLGAFTAYVRDSDHNVSPDYTATSDENGVATVNSAAMGQYIIVGDGSPKGPKIYQTVTAEVKPHIVEVQGKDTYMLYSTYNVGMKTSTPDIIKEVSDENITMDGEKPTANIGDTISYKLTVAIPVYPANATNKTFYVGDFLSQGLTLKKESIIVKGIPDHDLTENNEYSIEVVDNNNTTDLFIDFKFDEIKGYEKVTIEYQAVLNTEAEAGTAGNNNNANLIYSNKPYDGNTWEPGTDDRPSGGELENYGQKEDHKTIYTYALAIDKFKEGNESDKLKDAVFEIYNNEELSGTPIAEIKTDSNGVAVYKGLAMGNYWIKETVAPSGYNLIGDPIKITIDGSVTAYSVTTETEVIHYVYTSEQNESQEQATLNGDLVWINDKGEIMTGEQLEGYQAAYEKEVLKTVNDVTVINKNVEGSNGYYRAGIANNTGAQLPSTGGIGTTIFTVAGLVLMIGTAIVMITRRRMVNN